MGLTTKEISSSSFNDMISSVDRRSEYVENRAGANVRLNNFLTPYTLDDKSSILNAPCGYSNGVYPSLRPVGGENLLLQSNQFDTTWSKSSGITLTSGQSGYDGSNNAWLVERSAAYDNILQSNSSFFTPVSTISVYAKAGTYNFLRLAAAGVPDQVYFNLTDGSLGVNSDLIASSAQSVGNGWWRLSATFKDSAASGIYIQPVETDSGVGNAGTGSIYIQDAQLEKGPRANKYIETTTSPAINADFSFTRGSAATRVTKDGLIKNVQILSDELVQNGDFEEIGSEEVTNGDFEQIGSELVTNGDFATDSDWTKQIGTTISNGQANFVNAGGVALYQGVGTQTTFLKVTFEVTQYTSGVLKVYSGSNENIANTNLVGFSSIGLHTRYVPRSGTNGNIIFGSSSGEAFNGSIDNVSVKEVGQNWDFGTGWSMGDGKASCDGTNITYLTQTAILNSGKSYKVQFDIVDYTSGSVKYRDNGLVSGQSFSGVGSYTDYVTAGGGQFRLMSQNFVGSIDNVSVKEVGQNWTFVNSDISIGDDGLEIISKGGNRPQANQSVSGLTIGGKYRLSAEAKKGTCNLAVEIEISGIGSTVNTNKNNTTEFKNIFYEFIATSTTHTIQAKIDDGASTVGETAYFKSVSVIEITDDTDLPRIDYTNGTGSLLLEPQSTNLLTYSEDFSHSYWGKSQISVVDDFTISPDGTQNASKIIINSSTPFLGNTNISLTTGSVYTISCFVKKGTNRWVRLSSVSSASLGAWFDLENNVVGTVNSTSASIENYGNGWYKISNTLTAISGSNQTFLGLSDADGGTTSTQVGNTVFAWGFQVEEQSYATSYIPTQGSTVTRNADVCNNAGSSDLINSTEGVLYAEISALHSSNIFDFGLYGNTSTNQLRIGFFNNDVYASLYNGSYQTQMSAPNDLSDFTKIAFKFKENDFALWINGNEVANDTIGTTFNSGDLVKLNLSAQNGTSSLVLGNVRSVAVFKEALTDEELAKITSTTQQEVFYEMRDKMLQIDADYYEFGDYTTRLKKLF